ncbi:MAG: hypothetical protein IT348_06010, partial [Candidatus Eisenbacteria bacterium]|nr:hypothetical protein [Candidatus Eisenbacteria bacterium]
MPSLSTTPNSVRRRLARFALLPMLVALLAGPSLSHAAPGDERWSADFGAPGLTGSSQGWWSAVRSVVDWNGTLVVGGNLTHAGGTPVNNVVRWNGAAFESLGDGLDGTVTSLAVVGGTLYAAGDFTSSGATALPNVARWTGSAWVAVGNGSPDDASELRLVADGADLLLLGRFETVGSPPVFAAHIARWNGSVWSDVGGFAPGVSGVLRAAARVGSILYVGGIKDDGGDPLCSFDGTTWTYDVGALDGEVQHLAAVGTDLYLAGDFSSADEGAIALAQLARWDGVAMSALTNDVSDVLGMGEDGGRLFVHGAFVNHPGPFSSWWDGAGWNAGPDRVWGRFGANLTTFARVGSDL